MYRYKTACLLDKQASYLCLFFSPFLPIVLLVQEGLRLQYDYGSYSTYDYDHITLQDTFIYGT